MMDEYELSDLDSLGAYIILFFSGGDAKGSMLTSTT
jgi:hypothetical protein